MGRVLRNRVGSLLPLALLSPVLASAQSSIGRVTGVVFDSVAMRPVPTAVVQVVSVADPAVARTVTTDALGRFSADSMPEGRWALAAMHPRLDSLGLDQVRAVTDVRSGGTARVTLAVPNARRLTELVCGTPMAAGESSGYLTGTLRSAAPSRAPVAGRVRVDWLELTIGAKGYARTRESREVEVGSDGRFLACGLPSGGLVRAHGASGADSSGFVDLAMPLDGVQVRDLYVGRARIDSAMHAVPPDSGETDSNSVVMVKRGEGRLRGRVVDASGRAMRDVRLLVREAGVDTRTDDAGRFTFGELPTGTYTLDARAIGHEPLTRPVDIVAGDSAALDLTLDRLAPLDTMRIRAMRPSAPGANLLQFEERRKVGLGRYLGPEQLEDIQPLVFTDIIRRLPSLRLERGDYGYVVTMRATGWAPRCAPRVYVDNVITPNDGSLDSFLAATQVAAIEVYSGAFGPPQYMDYLSGCGSIVVWTGPRTSARGKR